MEASILIGNTLGILFLITGPALMINDSAYSLMVQEFAENHLFVYFSGLISLIIGALIIQFHNVWVYDWRLLITVIGWGALVKGSVRILAPKIAIKFATGVAGRRTVVNGAGLATLLMGMYLLTNSLQASQ